MLGKLPEGWRNEELGTFCVEHSRRANSSDVVIFSVSKDYGLIAQSELFDRRIASADTSNYKTLKRGEYAYDPMLLWTGSIGCLFRADEAMISPAYTTFGIDEKRVLPKFFDTLIKLPRMVERYRSISHGTNVRRKKAHFDDFSALVVLLPPLPEQRAIADVLGAVEMAISRTEALIEELKDRKADLLKLFDAAGSPVRKTKLRSLVNSMTSGVSVGGEVRDRGEHEFGVLRTSSVSSGIFLPDQIKVISRTNIDRAATNPKADCIIISRANTPELVGASAYVKDDYNNVFLSDKLWQLDVKDRNSLNVRWLSLALGTPRMRKLISLRANGTSSSMQNISKSAFLGLEIAVPSIEIQNIIADATDAFEKRQLREQSYLNCLKQTRSALAQELLSGRLRLPQTMIARHSAKPEQAA